MRRALLIPLILLLTASCSQKEASSEKGREVYATAKLEVLALQTKYTREIGELLSEKEVPREVKSLLKAIYSYLTGRNQDPFTAYRAVELLEEYQRGKNLRVLTGSQIRELKKLIETKAKYSGPVVG